MDRAAPCGSKICAKRTEQRRLDIHRARLRTAKALVDTSEPAASQFDHVRNNWKKELKLEERYSEIDRENRILLGKMTNIAQQEPHRPPHPLGPQSMNREARKRELLRITQDNQSILKRIQKAQPVYNHVELEDNHRRQQGYLRNCVEFPLVLRSARGVRPSELVPVGDQRPMSARSSRSENVLKEGRMLSGRYHLVEMAVVSSTGELRISAYDGDAKRTLELTLGEEEHKQLFHSSHGEYALIARRLALEGDSLVLTEPERLQPLDAGRSRPWDSGHLQPADVLSQRSPDVSQPQSANGEARVEPDDELDIDAMVVKTQSGASVSAQIDVLQSGVPQVRLRGLTPPSAGSVGTAWD